MDSAEGGHAATQPEAAVEGVEAEADPGPGEPSAVAPMSVAPASATPDDPTLEACFWTGWACGEMECPQWHYIDAVDFNDEQSEGCWGAGNNYDEPRRRLRCCSSSDARHDGCFWSGWQCGATTCPDGYFLSGVDFNIEQSEGCWGAGNDYDEPFRRVLCCSE